MHRLIVALLSALDAALAAAVGVAAVLAPLTLMWIFGFGDTAPWGALWPASVSVWQFGNLVPLQVTLPDEYLVVAGIDQDAASFVLSLSPLAFAVFTAIFAARSGMRASRADAWMSGVGAGAAVFAVCAALAALTSRNDVAMAELWQAILFPALVFAVPAAGAAIVTEWCEASSGVVARVRDRVEQAPRWAAVPALAARGTAAVLAGLVGVGALLVATALVLRGAEVVALFEAGNVDVLGAVVVALGQLAYLPTLVVWGMSFIAGPGFAVGAGTAVSPAGTQLGVVPGVPVLGILPELVSPWLLLLALLPIAVGAFAGWIVRSRLGEAPAPAERVVVATSVFDSDRTSALVGLLAATESQQAQAAPAEASEASGDSDALGAPGTSADAPVPPADSHEPWMPRLVITVAIAVASAGGAALLAWVSSGSIGPGRLAEAGPQPGPVALLIGLEVLVGAGILVLSPRRATRPSPVGERSRDADAGGDRPPID